MPPLDVLALVYRFHAAGSGEMGNVMDRADGPGEVRDCPASDPEQSGIGVA